MASKIQLSSQTYILLFFFTFSYHVHSQTNFSIQERDILLKMKELWLNPPSLSHWTPLSNPCTWPEINCTTNSVTNITVANQNITQPIPPSICELKNLAHLDLNNNDIPGTFPTALYNCSNLQYLDLSDNYFIGLIPDDIDRLSAHLEVLNLGDNNFTGNIPASIARLSGLKELRLFGNFFNGTFPEEIGNLLNLQVLVLSQNGFVPQTIPSSFMGLKNLKDLWMYGANLIGEIPQDIGNLTKLESLDLSQNSLDGSIPSGLFLLKNLSLLYLYKNQLSGPIPPVIEALNLKVLDLYNNSLTGSIPDDLGNLNQLTGLALSFNQLSGQVPVSIGRLPALEDVRLFSNNLSGELPPDFGRYSPLTEFQVCSNSFSGNLPEYLCSNNKLSGLIAFSNNLSGILPQTLENCSSLQYVQLYNNRLSGQIPVGLWSSDSLNWLMISDNMFNGQLPGNSGSNLLLLKIDNNQFTGEVPAGLSNSIKLQVIKARNNSFNGQIPKALGDLPVLTDLDLSENDFSGEIPPNIAPLKLNFLNLSSNHLSGRLPMPFENGEFYQSFLNNPNLCTSTPSLGLRICKLHDTNKLSPSFIVLVSSIAATAFLLAIIFRYFLCFRKKDDNLASTWKLTSFQKLTFTESTILSNLTENNLVGSGGSGKVYRVPINQSGEYVAVKSIFKDKFKDQRLEKQFLAEFEILGNIRHNNIVKLMCCLSNGNSNLLVYEYMENQSLDLWLHRKKKRTTMSSSVVNPVVLLEWPQRFRIAVATAKGLCYMHHDCQTPVIHRDMKSANILLDSNFNAKIADFGLARVLYKDGVPNTVSHVAGSFGYIAPEYWQSRKVNEKIDVYSFGVILLELVTGKEANNGDEYSSLADWARRLIQEEKPIEEIIDDDIKEAQYLEEIIQVFKLGIYCTNVLPLNRPTMKKVLQILQSFQPLPLP